MKNLHNAAYIYWNVLGQAVKPYGNSRYFNVALGATANPKHTHTVWMHLLFFFIPASHMGLSSISPLSLFFFFPLWLL